MKLSDLLENRVKLYISINWNHLPIFLVLLKFIMFNQNSKRVLMIKK